MEEAALLYWAAFLFAGISAMSSIYEIRNFRTKRYG